MNISVQELRNIAETILNAVGESPENSKIAAEIMADCDASGVSTHGSHMLTLVYNRRKVGQLNFPTNIEILQDNGASVLINGNDGLGQIAAHQAVDLAAERAKSYGIGAVMVRNTNNVGALGYYTGLLAKKKMIGILLCNASPAMAPWGASEQFFGTQPFSIGIYGGGQYTFSADMATSVVARGKIRKAAREGYSIPDNWALDVDGNPTTDPAKAIKGILQPIGGAKGSAIAFAIDIIAGLLTGSSYAPNVKAIHYLEGAAGVGCTLIAIDIEHFMPMEEYEQKITAYFASAKALKPAAGFTDISLPGENKDKKREKAAEAGIELSDTTAETIRSILKEIGSDIEL